MYRRLYRQTYRRRGHEAEARFALIAALSGAASAFIVMSLFVVGLFYFDIGQLGTLARKSAGGVPLWVLLWLPAVCGVIGFAIGPAIAGPVDDASANARRRGTRPRPWW